MEIWVWVQQLGWVRILCWFHLASGSLSQTDFMLDRLFSHRRLQALFLYLVFLGRKMIPLLMQAVS
jgi:hypothetical protein